MDEDNVKLCDCGALLIFSPDGVHCVLCYERLGALVAEPVLESDRFWCPECRAERVDSALSGSCEVCGGLLQYIEEQETGRTGRQVWYCERVECGRDISKDAERVQCAGCDGWFCRSCARSFFAAHQWVCSACWQVWRRLWLCQVYGHRALNGQ